MDYAEQRYAEACLESFVSYFYEAEDYLNVYTDMSVTFEHVVYFMSKLRETEELGY